MKTNRPHHSWSQQQLFLSSKLSFYKRYVLGEESRSNIRFDKGKELGKYLETGQKPHWVTDPLLETIGKAVERFELMEEKIVFSLHGDMEDKPEWSKDILMFTDSSKADHTEFMEYKTGKEPWTQLRVDTHDQLSFYAMGLFIAGGQKQIPSCALYWIETEDIMTPGGNIEVRYTGHIEKFIRTFSEQEILHMMMKTLNVMQEIHEYEYTEMELEDEFVDRYSFLAEEKAKIDEEMNIMRLEVMTKMQELDLKYATGTAGKFSLSQRKNWAYTDELTELTKKYDDEIKKKRAKEQKSGDAKFTVTESLRFNPIKK